METLKKLKEDMILNETDHNLRLSNLFDFINLMKALS